MEKRKHLSQGDTPHKPSTKKQAPPRSSKASKSLCFSGHLSPHLSPSQKVTFLSFIDGNSQWTSKYKLSLTQSCFEPYIDLWSYYL